MKFLIKNKKFYLLIIFLIYVLSLSSQSKQYIFKSIKETSDSLYKIKQYAKADSVYLNAKEFYKDKDDWLSWHKVIYYLRNRYQKKKEYIKASLLLQKFELEIPIREIELKAIIQYQIGYNHIKLLEYGKANQKYKSSIKLFKTIDNNKNQKYLFKMLNSLALNYSRMGDQRSAIKYCNSAINYCIENKMFDKLCYLYINKGQFYFYNGNYLSAIEEYKKANKTCLNNYDKSFIQVSMAEVFLVLKKFNETKKLLDVAFQLDSVHNEYLLDIKAKYLFEIGNFIDGMLTMEKAIEIIKQSENKRYLIKELITYSEILFNATEKDEAISYAHKGLCLFYPELDSLNILERPVKNDKLHYTFIIEALYIKAKYFREKYIETNDEFSLGEATFYYDLLLSHFDRLKSEYYSSSSQYRMGAYSQKIYSEIITFYVDQYNMNKNQDDLKNAFSLAQRANSFVLKNAVSDRKALELAGVQQDSLEQYLQLASVVASDANEDSISATSVFMEFDAYKASLLSNYPSYGKYNKEEEISIEKLESSLAPNTLVLKYYYFNDVMTVIGITNDLIFAENIPFTKEMDSIINSNLEILSQNESNDSLANNYLSNSKKIYDLILGDLITEYSLNTIDHLTIIPDGPLKKVSFNALAIKEIGDWNDPDNYLISKYTINYLYYCSQLDEGNTTYKSKGGFLGFGIEYEDEFLKEIISDYMSNFEDNSSNSRAISLSPLKYADDEVLSSADILNGTSYINADVTPNQVYSTINNFDVIHFSAHSFVDEEDYLNSFVVLNKDEGENYQLKYSDILNLDIESELVVLSACQTSSGRNVAGEGLMSLSRAFVQSGSKATVGAYWNAPDYATKELMTLFYSNLKEGMAKSKAMQQAQIEYLTNDKISSPTIRSPFYWASWALYGNDQPLNMSTSVFDFTSWTTYLLLAAIALLFGLFIMYFLKKRSV